MTLAAGTDDVQTIITFLLVRGLIIAAAVLGLITLLVIAFLLVRRAGRLREAKQLVRPVARAMGNRTGAVGAVSWHANRYLDDDARGGGPRRQDRR
ncbi:hypothetical protein AFB00_30040 (plasmid) [Pseudonocardia sp. HH130630-07]|nr:hypothetical protein AFB00_30040 [Pseudonocardia sp. HH130630-07]